MTQTSIDRRLRAIAAATPGDGLAAATPSRAATDSRASAPSSSSPVAGCLLAWKDIFDVAGYPTRAGTRFLGAWPARSDHALVARASAAGAVCAGKAALTELACSVLGENDAVPAAVNPWDE